MGKKFNIEKIKSIILYLVRPELSIKQKLVNVVVFACVFIMIPSIITNINVGSDFWGIFFLILLEVVFVVILVFTNKYPDSKVPPFLFSVIGNLVLLPAMYFGCGGRTTGMLAWMIMGSIIGWILTEGIWCYIIYALNVIIDVGLFYYQLKHPELVTYITEHDEVIDIAIAFISVTLVYGVVFQYQGKVYERQKQQLLEQETELREVNAELEKASQAKSDFLANMSHEIRTPINAILGLDEMILRECAEEKIYSYAEDIDNAGHALLSLVNDVLDFSKIESGKMEIHEIEYELFSLIHDCYNMTNMRAKKKDLKFVINNDPLLPAYLVGDEIRVRQIILNLLTNAIKYTRDGSVELYLGFGKIDDDYINLKIDVKDTGIGISPENVEQLFNMFSRVDEKKNRSIEGTGLGLAITKQFVEMMDGKIWVESELEVGSTFHAEIKQKIANNVEMGNYFENLITVSNACKPMEVKRTEDASFAAPNARVLVVDDVKMNLNVVRLLLKRTKVQVDTAISAREAYDYCRMKHYDVILMDHMMPEIDGIEALHTIESMTDSLNVGTPIIVLTANAVSGVEEMYLNEGFATYLSKPVKSEALEKVLLKYIPKEKIETVYE